MRAAEVLRFLGIERRVDAAVDDHRAARARRGADLVAAQRVAGVDADADDVAGLHGLEIERLERLIGDPRIAEATPASRAARTNSQRGVMTPTPNERWLGLTR